MIPAFRAWTESPDPGISTSRITSADADDLDLALSRADRLEKYKVLPRRVHEQHGLERRLRESAEMPARAHRADVDVGIEEVVSEPDPVAEESALRERARRIHGDDAHRAAETPGMPDERADEGRLPDAGRPGDADRGGATRPRIDGADDFLRLGRAILDQ